MRVRRLAAVVGGTLVGVAGAAGQGYFDVDRAPAVRTFIWWEAPRDGEASTPKPGPVGPADPRVSRELPPAEKVEGLPLMGRVLVGGWELTKAEAVGLRRAAGPEAKRNKEGVVELGPPGPVATVVLSGKAGGVERFEVLRGPHGEFLVRKAGDVGGRVRQLKAEEMLPLGQVGAWESWVGPAGWWGAEKQPGNPVVRPGVAVDVPRSMVRPGALRLEDRVVVAKGLRPARFRVDAAATEVGDATVRLRAPAGYTPRKPCGVLAWIDPGPQGSPPAALFKACDALNLAVVGVSRSGNECGTGDRTQRVLDAVATAEALLNVDRGRVYATGLSGGGRMTGIVNGCFPEVFSGGVSMAGVAHFADHPDGYGKIWPAYFEMPRGSRWDQYVKHRIAATTGPEDFNHRQSMALMEAQKEAGLETRAWVFDGLGHELPPEAGFEEALRWVDDPQRAAAEARDREGARLLAEAEKLPGDAGRKALLKVMEKAPWSPAAWAAAEKAGLKP